MKVLKFGGTSVGTAERIQNLRRIISTEEPIVVVLSAMAGVTNSLVESINLASNGKLEEAKEKLMEVEQIHLIACDNLFATSSFNEKGKELIKKIFSDSYEKLDAFDSIASKEIIALGEILSTNLFHLYLSEQEVESALIPAFSFMRIDKDGEPDYFYVAENLNRLLESCSGINVIITQGFICRNAKGEIDNLKRGGSDFTAAIIGNAINASEVQIWTDIDGFHNNDPRHVEGTIPIRALSFDEAAELAYFGAKILHPSTIHPCREKNIPVILKNTLNPTDRGTRITSSHNDGEIKAIAAKDGITAIRIKSLRMLMAHGFLKKIFDVFDEYKTPVDLITTSEVAVTLTIDDTSHLIDILKALRAFSNVETTSNQTILCVVGDFVAEKPGVAYRVLSALREIPVGQISYGGSSHNITMLIDSANKVTALQALQSILTIQSTVDTHSVDTPAYRYNLRLLDETLKVATQEASQYNYALHFAVKANSNPRILETIAKIGLGADCVSGNEIKAALESGFKPETIVFAGVGKTNDEIELAIRNRIQCIHVESLEELRVVNQICSEKQAKMPIALRLNPNLDAGTHKHITTGTSTNKFGLSKAELDEALKILPSLNSVKLIGFHFHIGSQILDLSKFSQLAHYANAIYAEYENLSLSYINLGGGLGVDYENPEVNSISDFEGYFRTFAENLELPVGVSVHFEPGRSIVAQCGELITRVLYVKEGQERFFAVVDAGMNNLIRPALYQAKHNIYCVTSNSDESGQYDVVGPICESSDTFATNLTLPKLTRGDLLAIRSAGAYGESMGSRYNLRNLTPSIFNLDKENVTA
jgi:diaminopimelate decarboxylase